MRQVSESVDWQAYVPGVEDAHGDVIDSWADPVSVGGVRTSTLTRTSSSPAFVRSWRASAKSLRVKMVPLCPERGRERAPYAIDFLWKVAKLFNGEPVPEPCGSTHTTNAHAPSLGSADTFSMPWASRLRVHATFSSARRCSSMTPCSVHLRRAYSCQ